MSKFWTNQEISFWQQFWFLRQLEIWFPRFGVVHFWNPPGRAPLLLPALCPISWRARGKPMGKPGKLKKLPNITLPFFLVQCSMRKRIFSLSSEEDHNSSRDKSPLQRLSLSSWKKSHSSWFFSQPKRCFIYLSQFFNQPKIWWQYFLKTATPTFLLKAILCYCQKSFYQFHFLTISGIVIENINFCKLPIWLVVVVSLRFHKKNVKRWTARLQWYFEEGSILWQKYEEKHRKNCECCPGHYLIVDHYSSI